MNFTISQMDQTNARSILTWRYDEPYSFYNPNPVELGKDLQVLINPTNLYYAVSDECGALVAYYCFGREAQVSGGHYSDDALDIGGGIRPDLTGRHFGPAILHAGLSFAQDRFAPRAFRVTVAAFNQRALKLCKRAGFVPMQIFSRDADEVVFVILLHRVTINAREQIVGRERRERVSHHNWSGDA
jgi:[ribosomal protein S18]-alanine N-acetyltransferase